jgi:hypothetical protein
MSGVFPSFSVTMGVAVLTGRKLRYWWMRPCHGMV